MPKERPGQSEIIVGARKTKVCGVVRKANGQWVLFVEGSAAARLADGRNIQFTGKFRMVGKQLGRKPRAAETKPRRKRGTT